MSITVGDLKLIISNVPDDVIIGGCGHFGELLECYSIELSEVNKSYLDDTKIKILNISIDFAGEIPD